MGLSSSFDRIGITDSPNPRTDQTTFQNALSSTFFHWKDTKDVNPCFYWVLFVVFLQHIDDLL